MDDTFFTFMLLFLEHTFLLSHPSFTTKVFSAIPRCCRHPAAANPVGDDVSGVLVTPSGWTDSQASFAGEASPAKLAHLHRFVIHGKDYGIAQIGGISFSDDPRKVKLADLGWRVKERFLYEYDFGNYWQHQRKINRVGLRLVQSGNICGHWRTPEYIQIFSPRCLLGNLCSTILSEMRLPWTWIDWVSYFMLIRRCLTAKMYQQRRR